MRQDVVGDTVSAKVLLKRERDRHNTYSGHVETRNLRRHRRIPEYEMGFSRTRRWMLSSAVAAEFSAAQIPVLPKLQHR